MKACMQAIRQAETPRPISARASTSCSNELACANSSAPPAASRSSVAFTRRGPNRSSSTPSGIWNKPKEKKYIPVSSPSPAAEMPNSDASTGPSTAFTARSTYEK
jgi:hypothetical protein